ncbi:hypothetical protein [Novosphingopyxis baekryungensis]|uniref:hypothetical protein n=1 Tax=Novosphingopyxis baekryungensis TaxID=279369 RepID=UPI000426595F|nr:hypothetical protein [Novosphingopyxis baekryungensis]
MGWGFAVVMIVIVSWIFYRYFAPRGWREWTGAGLVQAFIIALYAEMFGFPLTVYVLIRTFGIDREYVSANLWSTLVGLGETGMFVSMLVGYSLAIIGVGMFIHGWRAVYKARHDNRLVTDGLYRFVRHPRIPDCFSLCSEKVSFIGRQFFRPLCSRSSCLPTIFSRARKNAK